MEIEELRNVLGIEFAFVINEINPVLQDLKIEKTAKILDIGTGMGWMAITLALNNYKVITGEPEEDESDYAKQDWLESAKKVKVDHLITYIPFNAEDMPFEDTSVDVIFILGTLHHIDDIEGALKECLRVLSLNGILCIIEPNNKFLKIIREKKNPSHPDVVDPRNYTLENHLSFELVKLSYYDTYILRKK
ncbi:MAG: class I SAM-dependent methyltransferase [Promethearchaeota archaeon]